MTTRDVGTSGLVTPDQKCTEHVVTFQDPIGLPGTDDPLIGEKVANFEFSKSTKNKNHFQLVEQKIGKGEYQNPWEGIFSVK